MEQKSRNWTGAEVVILLGYGSGSMLRHQKFRLLWDKEKLKCFTGYGGLHVACVDASLAQLPENRLKQFLSTFACVSVL